MYLPEDLDRGLDEARRYEEFQETSLSRLKFLRKRKLNL